jgi:rhodanese-related sulfurtransferase
MPNSFGAPEIGVQQVNHWLEENVDFMLMDVREPQEYAVRIQAAHVVYAPLSALVEQGLEALPAELLDKEQQIVVFCHHGMRSAQVVMWLQQQGWSNALNMAGGIDAWAAEVDSSVGFY